jgi:hypothetical protein
VSAKLPLRPYRGSFPLPLRVESRHLPRQGGRAPSPRSIPPGRDKAPRQLYLRVLRSDGTAAQGARVSVMDAASYFKSRPRAFGARVDERSDSVRHVLGQGRALQADAAGELRFSSLLACHIVAMDRGELAVRRISEEDLGDVGAEQPVELHLQAERTLLVETVDPSGAAVGGVMFSVRRAPQNHGPLSLISAYRSYHKTAEESGRLRLVDQRLLAFVKHPRPTLPGALVVQLCEPGLSSPGQLVSFGTETTKRVRLVLEAHGSVRVLGLRPPELPSTPLFARLGFPGEPLSVQRRVAEDGSVRFAHVGLNAAGELSTPYGGWRLPALMRPGQQLEFDVRSVPHGRFAFEVTGPDGKPHTGHLHVLRSAAQDSRHQRICEPGMPFEFAGTFFLDHVPLHWKGELIFVANMPKIRASFRARRMVEGPTSHGQVVRLRVRLQPTPRTPNQAGSNVYRRQQRKPERGSLVAYVLRQPKGIESGIRARLCSTSSEDLIFDPRPRPRRLPPEVKKIPLQFDGVAAGTYVFELRLTGENEVVRRIEGIEVPAKGKVEDPRLAAIDLSDVVQSLVLRVRFPEHPELLRRHGGLLWTGGREPTGLQGYRIDSSGAVHLPVTSRQMRVLPIVPGARLEWHEGVADRQVLELRPALRLILEHKGGRIPLPKGVRMRAFIAAGQVGEMPLRIRPNVGQIGLRKLERALRRSSGVFDEEGRAVLESPSPGKFPVRFQLSDERSGKPVLIQKIPSTQLTVELLSGTREKRVTVTFDLPEIQEILEK